jgi:sugar-specific transcriptional regulator TrmB
MDIEPLLSLGLTNTEAKIYIDLLELGPSLVGTLSKKTGFHRRSLYDALERLINKGLVSYITTNNRKYFEAADPSTLLELQKEQEHRIKDLLPELNLKKQMSKDDNDTTFFRGVQGLKSVFNDQLKERKEILVFGASRDISHILKYYLPHYDNARKKYNIPVKIIYDNSSKQSLSKNIPLFEVKFLPKEYASPASTNIYGDKVAILLWEEEPLAIVIKNKKIADAYRSFFSLLWKTAKS